MDAVVAGEGHAARRPVSSTTRVTVPTGLRLPEAGDRLAEDLSAESEGVGEHLPDVRGPDVSVEPLATRRARRGVCCAERDRAAGGGGRGQREAIAATAARRLIINYHRHLAGRLRRL